MIGGMMAMIAQMAVCPVPAPVVPGLIGWATPRPVAGVLPVGVASTVLLTPGTRFPVAPEKTPVAGTTGAVVAVTIPRAGRYRVALGAPAWIDLLAAGKPVASVTHGHGPACTGVRKMVYFQLPAGRYSLQLSNAAVPTTTVMIAASK